MPPITQPYDFYHGIRPQIKDVNSLACMDGSIGQAKKYLNQLEERFIRKKVSRISMQEQQQKAKYFYEHQLQEHFDIINDYRARNLKKIFDKLVAVVLKELPDEQHPNSYNIYLIKPKRGKYLNAFTVGAGQVFMSTDLYNFCLTDAERASILSHELGHQIVGSANDNQRRAKIVENLLGEYADSWGEMLKNGWNALANITDSFDEQLCDFSGIYISSKAGYDVKACQYVDHRLSKQLPNDRSISRYLSSHPHLEVRNACNGAYILDAEIQYRNKHQLTLNK